MNDYGKSTKISLTQIKLIVLFGQNNAQCILNVQNLTLILTLLKIPNRYFWEAFNNFRFFKCVSGTNISCLKCKSLKTAKLKNVFFGTF